MKYTLATVCLEPAWSLYFVCVCVLSGFEVVVELWIPRPLCVRPGQSSCGLLALSQEDLPAQGSSV